MIWLNKGPSCKINEIRTTLILLTHARQRRRLFRHKGELIAELSLKHEKNQAFFVTFAYSFRTALVVVELWRALGISLFLCYICEKNDFNMKKRHETSSKIK